MNATILSALADSSLFLVGNRLTLADDTSMPFIGEDEDGHVALFEEWERRCMCCCCTGECVVHDDGYDFDLEEALFAGFEEGDL